MDTTRVILAIKLALCAFGLSLIVWWYWPYYQQVTVYLPAATPDISAHITLWGILFSITLMTQRVIPPYHRLRICANLAGICAFLVNLLYAKNSGNVSLQVALILITIWSIWANRHEHRPISATAQQWIKALLTIAFGYAVGCLFVYYWPVSQGNTYSGWYWPYIGLLGAFVLTTAIILLETRIIQGDHPVYPVIYGFGSVLLILSYFGEYNEAGLKLNAALMATMYGPMLINQLKRV